MSTQRAPARRLGSLIWRVLVRWVPTAFGVITFNFLLLNLLPGDAADAISGMSGSATAETMERLREAFGLNQNIFWRYVDYIGGVVQFDLGRSVAYGAPVFDVVTERLPNTLALMTSAFVIALVLGVLVGWVMAVFANRWPDRLLTVGVLFVYSAPGFWVGLMMIVLFSVMLGWLPSGGSETLGAGLTGFAALADRVRHLILPAFGLAMFYMAIYARLTRASLNDVLRQDFIRAAAAKGLHPLQLQLRHGLRNALIPVITVAASHLANLLGGTVVIEAVFDWPGLGQLMLNSLTARDFNVILGILLLSSFVVIASNIVVDVVLVWLDPRVRVADEKAPS